MPDLKLFLDVLINELKNNKTLLKQFFAELLGTFMYLAISTLVDHNKVFSGISAALSNGLSVGSVVQIIGHVSGGHINPAVTVGVLANGNIKPLRALCYIVAQIVGGIAGSAFSYTLVDKRRQELFGGIIQHTQGAMFALEMLLTFFLVAVVLSVTDKSRGARGLGSSALAIALSITACDASCSFYSVGINPVKMLGPACVASSVNGYDTSGDWNLIWIYMVAPLLGGVLAGLVYRFVLNLKVRDRSESMVFD